jgi:hypothetical protein
MMQLHFPGDFGVAVRQRALLFDPPWPLVAPWASVRQRFDASGNPDGIAVTTPPRPLWLPLPLPWPPGAPA